MGDPVENKVNTLLKDSGNSDVDLTVNVDINTKAIAYGMLCSMYAKGDLSDSELEDAIKKLDSLVKHDEDTNPVIEHKHNNITPTNRYKLPERRRFW
ncbi:hypothetical protein [Alkalibacillus aidingensis]|uniref:hypothetical protein n=1 Tax=Alkalibacillus aidingensis TaxID=2747607 RepID=UPI001661744C|nr:hypothetical protein [Alkalibacillus aidingensis]